jgi:signal transduction histidine kinase/ActR/RegA family two-component response regulator
MNDPEAWFRVIHPDDRPGLDESIAETHRTLEPWLWEGRAILGSGVVGWFRGLSTPRKLDDGSVLWNGLVLDITEMKEAEARLVRAQKMEAIGQLTGGVAHDFNNLLAVIMGNAEMLETRESGEKAERIQSILHAAERGAELVHRLLAFSRRQPLSAKPFDLRALVSGMGDLLARMLGETIDITMKSADDLWPALADQGQVEDALLNLAINGRDAMPEGGKLTIECANARLDDAYVEKNPEFAAGDYVVLAVRDTGVGIKSDVMQHVYEPFFTTKRFGDGSGLGLSMVYGFVKQSGGNITIDSAEGQGTVVRLYLPRAEEGFQSEKVRQDKELPRGQNEMVLVVEDDPDVRGFAVEMVKGLGYRVIEAADAATARQHLADGARVDLVLSDVVLPGGTHGPEFAKEALSTHPDLKFVFMSGYAAGDPTQGAFSLPGGKLLTKPFQRKQLAKALHEALHAHPS